MTDHGRYRYAPSVTLPRLASVAYPDTTKRRSASPAFPDSTMSDNARPSPASLTMSILTPPNTALLYLACQPTRAPHRSSADYEPRNLASPAVSDVATTHFAGPERTGPRITRPCLNAHCHARPANSCRSAAAPCFASPASANDAKAYRSSPCLDGLTPPLDDAGLPRAAMLRLVGLTKRRLMTPVPERAIPTLTLPALPHTT
jgi:hypothetical protein